MCLGLVFASGQPFLAWVFGCVCLYARSSYTPTIMARLCGVGVCVWVSGFGCAPPILAGVWGCVYLFLRPACTRPILAVVCGRCVPLRVSLSCRQSRLGRWGVFVGSCLRFACTLPILAGICCLCVRLRVLASSRPSLLGFVVCVSGFGSRFDPTFPGWGVHACMFACTLCLYPAISSWVCCACVPLRVLASARQSFLGFVAYGFWFGVCFHVAIPGWGVAVCVFFCALRLYPANPG